MLSSSFVKAPSIEAGGEAGVLAIEGEEVEYWRCLTCSIRGLHTCSRRVAEHRVTLLTIIATSFQCVDVKDTA
jgi:hypothetical protein